MPTFKGGDSFFTGLFVLAPHGLHDQSHEAFIDSPFDFLRWGFEYFDLGPFEGDHLESGFAALEILEHGITIIASGASEFKPDQYLYGKDPRIMTGLELDQKPATPFP